MIEKWKIFVSWKTSLAGIGLLFLGIYQLTDCQWKEGFTSLASGCGLLAARDNNVTSEQAGAK
jgi:hypothetical protein